MPIKNFLKNFFQNLRISPTLGLAGTSGVILAFLTLGILLVIRRKTGAFTHPMPLAGTLISMPILGGTFCLLALFLRRCSGKNGISCPFLRTTLSGALLLGYFLTCLALLPDGTPWYVWTLAAILFGASLCFACLLAFPKIAAQLTNQNRCGLTHVPTPPTQHSDEVPTPKCSELTDEPQVFLKDDKDGETEESGESGGFEKEAEVAAAAAVAEAETAEEEENEEEPGDSSILPLGVSQKLERFQLPTGAERVDGVLRAVFGPNQTRVTVFTGFCPPLLRVPTLKSRILEGTAVVEPIQIEAHGVSFLVRKSLRVPFEDEVLLSFTAEEPSEETEKTDG